MSSNCNKLCCAVCVMLLILSVLQVEGQLIRFNLDVNINIDYGNRQVDTTYNTQISMGDSSIPPTPNFYQPNTPGTPPSPIQYPPGTPPSPGSPQFPPVDSSPTLTPPPPPTQPTTSSPDDIYYYDNSLISPTPTQYIPQSPPTPDTLPFILAPDDGYIPLMLLDDVEADSIIMLTIRIQPKRCSEVNAQYRLEIQTLTERFARCSKCTIFYREDCVETEPTQYEYGAFLWLRTEEGVDVVADRIAKGLKSEQNLNITINAAEVTIGDEVLSNITIVESPGPVPSRENVTVRVEYLEETCFAYDAINEGCESVVEETFTAVVDEYRPWNDVFLSTSIGADQITLSEIIGGVPVQFERYPYMMSLQLPTQPEGCFDARCGATLIGPSLVLTAAHCLKQILGQENPQSGVPPIDFYAVKSPRCRHEGNNQTRSLVTYQHVHPQFETQPDGSFSHDIAILEIANNFSDPYMNIDSSQYYNLQNGQNLSVIGYGATADPVSDPFGEGGLYAKVKLQRGIITYQDNNECQFLAESIYGFPRESITLDKMCADTFSPNIVDTCVGDSGGPVFIQNDIPQKDIQLGLTSYGFPYFDPDINVEYACGGTTVYTRISEYLNWIYTTVPKIQGLQQSISRVQQPTLSVLS